MIGSEDLTSKIAGLLPSLRRYARALTGNQVLGDSYAIATLEEIVKDPTLFETKSPKISLFRQFHSIWVQSGAPVSDQEHGALKAAQERMKDLTVNSREALLLHSIEEFSTRDIASIMGITVQDADHLVATAHAEMEHAVRGRVMIIEDEAIIAMDIAALVGESGHTVVGIARTRDEARVLAHKEQPDLILSDIQLADNSSGIDAVKDILIEQADCPVIFITAFPERLLTGDKPEPAFLIPKPYSEDHVRSAISQAMFFASTQTLT